MPAEKWRSAVDVDVGCKNSVSVREAYDSRECRGETLKCGCDDDRGFAESPRAPL